METRSRLAARIKKLEDHFAITKLKYEYWDACDNKDPKKMLKCFSMNSVAIDYEDFGVFGSAKEMVTKYTLFSCHNHLLEQHAGKNPILVMDGMKASGSWSMQYHLIDLKKKVALSLSGIYQDIYIVEHGRWVIKATTFKKIGTFYRSFKDGMLSNPLAQQSLGFK